MSRLGTTLRELMDRRNLSGVDLAAQVGISPTALSQILNGVSKPRQSTITRLVNRLCTTQEERSTLMAAYLGEEEGASEETYQSQGESRAQVVAEDPAPYSTSPDEEAAQRYMEIKAASIQFETDIAETLRAARIPVMHPFISEKVACDFVTKTKTKIAIDCKFNLAKDWDRLLGTCLLLKKNLPADEVVVAIPYHNATSRIYEPDFVAHRIYIETPGTLVERLKKLGA